MHKDLFIVNVFIHEYFSYCVVKLATYPKTLMKLFKNCKVNKQNVDKYRMINEFS